MSPSITTVAFITMPGGSEWLIILAVALLLFGRRLPEIMRGLGSSLREFRQGMGLDQPNTPYQSPFQSPFQSPPHGPLSGPVARPPVLPSDGLEDDCHDPIRPAAANPDVEPVQGPRDPRPEAAGGEGQGSPAVHPTNQTHSVDSPTIPQAPTCSGDSDVRPQ